MLFIFLLFLSIFGPQVNTACTYSESGWTKLLREMRESVRPTLRHFPTAASQGARTEDSVRKNRRKPPLLCGQFSAPNHLCLRVHVSVSHLLVRAFVASRSQAATRPVTSVWLGACPALAGACPAGCLCSGGTFSFGKGCSLLLLQDASPLHTLNGHT